MLLIVGTFRLPPENVSAARVVMSRVIEASRGEDGCLDYAYAEDVLEPGLIQVKELWTGQPALDRHFETEHIREWRASWERLGIADRDLKAFQVGEPYAV